MQDIHNGISAAQLEGATWRKSQRSNSQGACVELARLDSATVAMRNSRDPQGTALIYSGDRRPGHGQRAALRRLRLPGRLTEPCRQQDPRTALPAVPREPGAGAAGPRAAGHG